MKLVRLRQRSNSLPIIEVEEEFLFAATVLVHIERLPNVAVLAKRSWIMADAFEAAFTIDGHRFVMELRYGRIMIFAADPSVTSESIGALAAHIDNYHTVWPMQFLWAVLRYFFLPYQWAHAE